MEIQLQNLTKKFPNRNRKHPGDVIAVNEFNFTIPDGQLIGRLKFLTAAWSDCSGRRAAEKVRRSI